MKRCAVLSSDAMYRYALWREWDKGFPQILFIGLNPSTADAEYDDPTILRCVGFARQWGYGRLAIANLFAFRSTSPTNLKRCDNPVGVENNKWLETLSRESQQVVAAWGMHGGFRDGIVMSYRFCPYHFSASV